jgi:putative ABC transport system ATP-binding protein
MTFIRTTALTKHYRPASAEPVRALDGVDLEVNAGEYLAVLGPSGSGKSTLLNLLGGLDRPTSGDAVVGSRSLGEMSPRDLAAYRSSTVGFVFQSFHLQPRFPAWENVALPLVFSGADRRTRRRRAHELLDRVGLLDRADHRPGEMSGGEQQRVALARGLVRDPALLLGDEPTGNLDSRTSRQIMDILAEASEGGVTVVLVTHDADLAADYARRRVHMSDGRLVPAGAGPDGTGAP